MPYFQSKYKLEYSALYDGKPKTVERNQKLLQGYSLIESHPLFGQMDGDLYLKTKELMLGGGACTVDKQGSIYVNSFCNLQGDEWAYVFAHSLLHLAFGHFDKEKMPEDNDLDLPLWNKACDIYIARFLKDIKFGEAVCPDPSLEYKIKLDDEKKIYSHLKYIGDDGSRNPYSVNKKDCMDMIGLEKPLIYKQGEINRYSESFAAAMMNAVNGAVSSAGGRNWDKGMNTPVRRAAEWFMTHYPLLGGVAASFRIIEDMEYCLKYDIQIAAVDASMGEIYCNPNAGLSIDEWEFVLAHEFLHAGLMHHKRCSGRDPYLWNLACDFCVNGWLTEMNIGTMPSGVLYDRELKNLSAESIYDILVKEIRKYKKLNTLRGYGLGDVIFDGLPRFGGLKDKGVSLDELIKNALREGLDFHVSNGRGYLPAGLVDEIRALTSPPIPWEVELGQWFDCMFPPVEKHRSYVRPSRRQAATPDIPRPRYIIQEQDLMDRTFGVVVDTSGSVSVRQLGLSLGAIASYAASKEVRRIRVVFCDADAYDQGYMTPEELAGKVRVEGRGGTILQPGVNVLVKAKDFPNDGPILIITDGMIEHHMRITREHAFLIPKGGKLPFQPKGKVFYFK